MNDEAFLSAFHNRTLDQLTHADHVRVAWLVLQDNSLHAALRILRDGFLAFARSKGKPEVYHETITWSFTILMHQRMHCGRAGSNWAEFLDLNSDLATGVGALEQIYNREQLASNVAREIFVLPDSSIAQGAD